MNQPASWNNEKRHQFYLTPESIDELNHLMNSHGSWMDFQGKERIIAEFIYDDDFVAFQNEDYLLKYPWRWLDNVRLFDQFIVLNISGSQFIMDRRQIDPDFERGLFLKLESMEMIRRTSSKLGAEGSDYEPVMASVTYYDSTFRMSNNQKDRIEKIFFGQIEWWPLLVFGGITLFFLLTFTADLIFNRISIMAFSHVVAAVLAISFGITIHHEKLVSREIKWVNKSDEDIRVSISFNDERIAYYSNGNTNIHPWKSLTNCTTVDDLIVMVFYQSEIFVLSRKDMSEDVAYRFDTMVEQSLN